MREAVLRDGDYVPAGGTVQYAAGAAAELQRVLFCLRGRRGRFLFLDEMGSRLWQLGRLPASQRQTAAEQYVAEALAAEPVAVEQVELSECGSGVWALTVRLTWEGESLTATVTVQ